MGRSKLRYGKAAEHMVFGALLQAGLDVYSTIVDDQGIDGIIRGQKDGKVAYWDVQVKSSASWQGIRFKTESITSENYILVLFNSAEWELLWLPAAVIRELFPPTGYEWGDLFLRADAVRRLKDEGYGDLEKLR